MLIQEIVDAWAAVADEEVKAGLAVNHCILGTRTLMEVCHALAVVAYPVPVEVVAMNRPGAIQVALGVPYQSGRWPPEAWSVGATTRSTGPGYPGHLVLVAELAGRRWLVDSSSGQFRREQHGIKPPQALCVELVDTEWPADPEVSWRIDRGDWVMSWKPAPQLGNRHRAATDWRRGRTAYVDRVLDGLSQNVRQ